MLERAAGALEPWIRRLKRRSRTSQRLPERGPEGRHTNALLAYRLHILPKTLILLFSVCAQVPRVFVLLLPLLASQGSSVHPSPPLSRPRMPTDISWLAQSDFRIHAWQKLHPPPTMTPISSLPSTTRLPPSSTHPPRTLPAELTPLQDGFRRIPRPVSLPTHPPGRARESVCM